MKAFKVRVRNGKLEGEAPPGVPDGAEFELVIADPGDELTREELAELNLLLEKAWRSAAAGRIRSSADVLSGLGKDR